MKIKFIGSSTIITMDRHETLMDALVRNGIPIQNVCNGMGTCGKCKVRIINNAPPPTERDRAYLSETDLKTGIRLACAVISQDDMVIELNREDYQDRKEAAFLGMKLPVLDPGIEKVFITLSKPTLEDERGDWDRIVDELSIVKGESGIVKASLQVLRKAPKVIRESNYELTITLADHEIIEIEGGDTTSRQFGVAVDIGTTSVAAALVDLLQGTVLKVVSAENEQTVFGADVITRLSFASESPDNLNALKNAIQKTMNRLLTELERKATVKPTEIYKMTVVGNTTMHHLFMGFDVSELAVSPFVSVCNRPLVFSANEIGLAVNPQAKLFLFPNIGGFVGGDTLGAIIGAPEVLEPGNHLLIDLGTNCELFLKTNSMMMACSTAAGPAFEGAGITHGMRAKKGAIESIKLSTLGVSCQVIGGQVPIGVCGSGLIEGIDEMRRAGVLNKQGRIGNAERIHLLPQELQRRIRTTEKGNEFILTYNKDQESEITITQKDVGELQFAKGAVYAGIKTLMEMAGLEITDLDTVTLTGTFATYLNPENIINIGLVPNFPAEKIKTVGNAAHIGAIYAMFNQHILDLSEELYCKIKHIELGGSNTFSNYFMNSMFLEKSN